MHIQTYMHICAANSIRVWGAGTCQTNTWAALGQCPGRV